MSGSMNRHQPTRHATTRKGEDFSIFAIILPQNRHILPPFPGLRSIAVGKRIGLIGLSINDSNSRFMALSMLPRSLTCDSKKPSNGNEPSYEIGQASRVDTIDQTTSPEDCCCGRNSFRGSSGRPTVTTSQANTSATADRSSQSRSQCGHSICAQTGPRGCTTRPTPH